MVELYEFFYRGPTPHNDGKPTYHVILSEEISAFGETKTLTKGPLTPTQADAEGFTLDVIQGAMAAQLTLALDAEKTAHEATKKELEDERAKTKSAIDASADIARELVLAKGTIENMLADMTTLDEAVRAANLRADTAETRLNQAAQLAGTVDAAKEPGLLSKALAFVGLGKSE